MDLTEAYRTYRKSLVQAAYWRYQLAAQDAEEIVQETFITAHKTLQEGPIDVPMRAFLFTHLKWAVTNFRATARRAKRNAELTISFEVANATPEAPAATRPDHLVLVKDLSQQALRAIDKVSTEAERRAFQARYGAEDRLDIARGEGPEGSRQARYRLFIKVRAILTGEAPAPAPGATLPSRDALRALYTAQGRTLDEIAEQMGLTVYKVRKLLLDYGIAIRRRGTRKSA